MELELWQHNLWKKYVAFITLFLYGIGAKYSGALVASVVITLFLYGIGAFPIASCFCFLLVLHYSYMELELSSSVPCFNFSIYYIIPIWNWSSFKFNTAKCLAIITLFLYGIGAFGLESPIYNFSKLHYSYMELEPTVALLSCLRWKNYIIPIWNWSISFHFQIQFQFQNYIIPIWNWSLVSIFFLLRLLFITLFLYGIGAIDRMVALGIGSKDYIIPIWNWSAVNSLFRYSEYFLLHYSYMELEPCAI